VHHRVGQLNILVSDFLFFVACCSVVAAATSCIGLWLQPFDHLSYQIVTYKLQLLFCGAYVAFFLCPTRSFEVLITTAMQFLFNEYISSGIYSHFSFGSLLYMFSWKHILNIEFLILRKTWLSLLVKVNKLLWGGFSCCLSLSLNTGTPRCMTLPTGWRSTRLMDGFPPLPSLIESLPISRTTCTMLLSWPLIMVRHVGCVGVLR